MFKLFSTLLIIFTFFFFSSCNGLYKAGNRVTLDYVIDTKLSFTIIKMYVDSLVKDEYKVPQKWKHHDKLVDIDPEEMYLIQFNGVLLLADVYNPQIVDGDYVAVPERMPKDQKERVIRRFKQEILGQVEQMAKRDGCPDSVLYYKPSFGDGYSTKRPEWSPKKDTSKH